MHDRGGFVTFATGVPILMGKRKSCVLGIQRCVVIRRLQLCVAIFFLVGSRLISDVGKVALARNAAREVVAAHDQRVPRLRKALELAISGALLLIRRRFRTQVLGF